MYKKRKKDEELVEGVLVASGLPCFRCQSKDNLAVWRKEKDDGESYYYDASCFTPGCGYMSPQTLSEHYPEYKEDGDTETTTVIKETGGKKLSEEELEAIENLGSGGSKKRGLKKSSMEFYGIKIQYAEDGAVRKHYYPITKENVITGYKIRELPKKFSSVGDCKQPQLFGQSLYEDAKVQVSNKFLCIAEGELDCVALYQVLKENGNPRYENAVVSIPSGASSAVKAIQNNWKWVNTFDQIILFFDQDEPGKKAALDVAKTLPLGKVKIAKFSEKDPCDMVKAEKEEELYNAFWKSEVFAPDGVLAGAGLWNLVNAPLTQSNAHYPWEGLDKMLHGIREAEMVTLTAGSGVAKSTFARMIAYHLQKSTDDNIGMIFLEESVKKTSLQMMSLAAGKQLHLPDTEATEEERREAFDKTMGTGQYYYYDDFASQDFEGITESILYMAKAANCKYIFLDHISMLVSGGEQGDERRALDAICTKLRSMVQQLDITLFPITHLKRPQGLSHEEGGQTSLAQLRGSAGIAQLSDIVIGFERNSQADDETERNTTHIRILKNRFSGDTGLACSLLYDKVTGHARELTDAEVEDMDTDTSEFDLRDFDEELTTTEEY